MTLRQKLTIVKCIAIAIIISILLKLGMLFWYAEYRDNFISYDLQYHRLMTEIGGLRLDSILALLIKVLFLPIFLILFYMLSMIKKLLKDAKGLHRAKLYEMVGLVLLHTWGILISAQFVFVLIAVIRTNIEIALSSFCIIYLMFIPILRLCVYGMFLVTWTAFNDWLNNFENLLTENPPNHTLDE